jgi:hypothetical protein
MYLRNVQQLLRDARPSFDVRGYGFGTLVDLLRAAHRDGVVRVDRDRQGVIRVFQSTAQPAGAAAMPEPPPQAESESSAIEAAALEASNEPTSQDTTREAESDADDDNIGNVAPDAAPAPKAGRRRSTPAHPPRPARRRRPRKAKEG